MILDISEFYKINKIDHNFDEILYSQTYPETKDFYQPYCKNNFIDEKHKIKTKIISYYLNDK